MAAIFSRKISAVIFTIIFSTMTWADLIEIPVESGVLTAQSKAEFCSKAGNPQYFSMLLQDEHNQLGYRNDGGFLNGGVCWWHSMFSRNMTYLSVFRPELPKPSPEKIKEILFSLTTALQVVEIPGFTNWQDFSTENYHQIQAVLDEWQIVDGGFFFGWLRGLAAKVDHNEETAENLRKTMEDLFSRVSVTHEVIFQLLNLPGIDSHAWLVLDVRKVENGYDLIVTDSNFGNYIVHYHYGDSHLPLYELGPIFPHTERNDMQFWLYPEAIARYCH